MGKVPVEVKDIKLNGAMAQVVWTTTTNWNISIILTTSSNNLTVTGYNWHGNQLQERDIGDYVDSITVYYP